MKVALSPSPSVNSPTAASPSRFSGIEAARPRLNSGPSNRAPCSLTVGFVPATGVVERGPAFQPERQSSANDANSPDEVFLRRRPRPDGHVIFEFPDAVGVQKAADQDIRFRPVVLLVPQTFRRRGDTESPALVRIENRAEDARRIEARQAQPIDRPVQPDQGGRPHVADDAVILDRLVVVIHRFVRQSPGSHPSYTFTNSATAAPAIQLHRGSLRYTELHERNRPAYRETASILVRPKLGGPGSVDPRVISFDRLSSCMFAIIFSA